MRRWHFVVAAIVAYIFLWRLKPYLHFVPVDVVPVASSNATVLSPTKTSVNGVVLFLHGGRWHKFFVRECLPRLQEYFLRCYHYPVRIFHEGIAPVEMQDIRSSVRGASSVHFENVAPLWKTLPHNLSEATLQTWMQEGSQRKFQGRGYRLMCRFWAGIVWTLPSLDRYEYYWRLDTDSILTRPVSIDPFQFLVSSRCQYGYNRLKGENPYVLTGLWDAYQKWEQSFNLTPSARKAVREIALDGDGQYWGPMYYNNFELGSFSMKRDVVYQSFFRFVDQNAPFGIFRYRWGDAPLHTLGVLATLEGRHMCNVTQKLIGYRHAVTKVEPIETTQGC